MLDTAKKLLIVSLLKDSQYQTGIDANGKPTFNKQLVRVPYSLLYRILKGETKPVNDEINAINSFFAEYENSDLYYIFTDSDGSPTMTNEEHSKRMFEQGFDLFAIEKGEQNGIECYNCVISSLN